jgi:hypothetical protein
MKQAVDGLQAAVAETERSREYQATLEFGNLGITLKLVLNPSFPRSKPHSRDGPFRRQG